MKFPVKAVLAKALVVVLAGIASGPCANAAGEEFSCPAVGGPAAPQSVARDAGPDAPFTRPEEGIAVAKRTARGLYLTAVDAYEMVSENPSGVLFIDVRTRGELQFIGMASAVDAHVPFLVEANPLQWDEAASSFRLVVNPDFVAAVDRRRAEKRLGRDAPVIVMCQAGLRAAAAVNVLTRAGYALAYTVVDGFEGDPVMEGPTRGLRLVNGWRNAGLPWTTRLERTRMYGLD